MRRRTPGTIIPIRIIKLGVVVFYPRAVAFLQDTFRHLFMYLLTTIIPAEWVVWAAWAAWAAPLQHTTRAGPAYRPTCRRTRPRTSCRSIRSTRSIPSTLSSISGTPTELTPISSRSLSSGDLSPLRLDSCGSLHSIYFDYFSPPLLTDSYRSDYYSLGRPSTEYSSTNLRVYTPLDGRSREQSFRSTDFCRSERSDH